MSELKAQDCELEYWNQQAEDYALVQIPCEDLRAIISRAWEAPAFNSALTASEARAEAAEALEWQPIETAPKDGSSILVACKNGAIYAVWWCTVSDPAFDLEPCWCVTGGDDLARKGNDARTPTHWRPLPAYPARAALKETTDV